MDLGHVNNVIQKDLSFSTSVNIFQSRNMLNSNNATTIFGFIVVQRYTKFLTLCGVRCV